MAKWKRRHGSVPLLAELSHRRRLCLHKYINLYRRGLSHSCAFLKPMPIGKTLHGQKKRSYLDHYRRAEERISSQRSGASKSPDSSGQLINQEDAVPWCQGTVENIAAWRQDYDGPSVCLSIVSRSPDRRRKE